MFIFKKNINNTKKIKNISNTINLNKVLSIDIQTKNETYNTRFFYGEKENDVNIKLSFGIKENNNINKNDVLTLIFKLINGNRYKQTAFVSNIRNYIIITDLYNDIEKLEEKRNNVKVKSDLCGEICVMDKRLCVEITDICMGGVFIRTDYDFTTSNIYNLKINDLDIQTRVKLLRKHKTKKGEIEGYGCQFKEISEKNIEKIYLYVNSVLFKEREILISRDVYNYFKVIEN